MSADQRSGLSPALMDILAEAQAGAVSADADETAPNEPGSFYESLTDEEWAVVEPFLWQAAHSIVPAREMFDGVMQHLVDGVPWTYVAGGFASRQFLVRRINNGSVHRMLEAVMPGLGVERQAQFVRLGQYADVVTSRRRLLKRRGGVLGPATTPIPR